MLCTSCGRNNSDYALTCSKCGASLKKRGDVQKPVRDLSRPIAQSQLQSTASETYQNDINRVMPGESKVEPVNSFTNKISQDSLESIDSLNDHKDYHNKTQSIFPENLPEIDMGNMDVENKDISQFSDYKIVSNIPDTSYSNKTGNDKIQAVFTRIEEVFESLWHDIKGVFDSLNNSNQQKKQNLHTLAHESVADDSDDWHVKIDDETGFSDNPKTKAVHIEHEYHKLGGWLAFLAYGLLVLFGY